MQTKYRLKFLSFIFFTIGWLPALGQVGAHLNMDEVRQRAEKHVSYLSSEKFLGRSSVTGHDLLASFYIDSLFKSYNLNSNPQVAEQSHFQPFTIVQTAPLEKQLFFNGKTFHYGRDFICYGTDPKSLFDYELVFGGLGEYAEIDTLDLNGKALIILSSNLRVAGMKVQEHAASKGCALIIVANPNNTKQFDLISQQLIESHTKSFYKIEEVTKTTASRFFSRFKDPIPQIVVSDGLANELLGENPVDIWKKLQKSAVNKPIPRELRISFDFKYHVDTMVTQNVVAWVPSQTPSLQSVVIGAHFDHLAPEGNVWYPGADDNASGVAVLLEAARLIANDVKNGYRPRRNIVFAAFTAEEIGLHGSHYYTNNPLFPIDSTCIMLNFDMVGRMAKSEQKWANTLHVGGLKRIKEIKPVIAKFCTDSLLTIESESLAGVSLFSMSDHNHFENKGIPAFLFTSGLHNDYHKPTDTPEKLEYDNLSRLVLLAYQAIRHFADTPNPWE